MDRVSPFFVFDSRAERFFKSTWLQVHRSNLFSAHGRFQGKPDDLAEWVGAYGKQASLLIALQAA